MKRRNPWIRNAKHQSTQRATTQVAAARIQATAPAIKHRKERPI